MHDKQFRFLLGVLTAFNVLRHHSKTVWDVYFDRLLEEAKVETSSSPNDETGQASTESRLRKRLQGIQQIVRCISAYMSQLRHLEAKKRSARPGDCVALAASSRRLYSFVAKEHPRKYFAYLASQSFNGELHPHGLDRLIEKSPVLFIFEPERNSPLWSQRESCWNEGVFIIDGNFLIFTALITLMKGRGRLLFKAIRSLGIASREAKRIGGQTPSAKQILIASLCADAYDNLLQDFTRVDSVFLTSNSFLTEVLRFHLLKSRNCRTVCEIMHGVPTIVYERYLNAMLEAGKDFDSYQKHSSIGQIPGLAKFGVLESDVKLDTSTAINTYLNRYFSECSRKYPTSEAYIQLEMARVLGAETIPSDAFIVTFIGGMSNDADFFSSSLFALEKILIDALLEPLKEAHRPYRVLYAPHPGHDFGLLQKHPFFKERDIALAPNTVFTWFVSDLAIGTFSGALFECSHFDVKTFGPMKVADDLYPKVILDTISYQSDDQNADIAGTTKEFVRTRLRSREPRVNLTTRAIARLSSLTPRVWPHGHSSMKVENSVGCQDRFV